MLAHRLLALACARHTQNRVPISNLVEPPFHTGFCHIWRVLQGWSFKSDAFDPVLAFCSHRRRKKDRKLNFFGSVVVKKKLGCFVKETPSTWNQRKFCFLSKSWSIFFSCFAVDRVRTEARINFSKNNSYNMLLIKAI